MILKRIDNFVPLTQEHELKLSAREIWTAIGFVNFLGISDVQMQQ